jgi:hypothetical protein
MQEIKSSGLLHCSLEQPSYMTVKGGFAETKSSMFSRSLLLFWTADHNVCGGKYGLICTSQVPTN